MTWQDIQIKLRQTARLFLAWMFWSHALGLTHLAGLKLGRAYDHRQQILEAILLAIIFFYSVLASNGWWSLFFDVFYIYVFPPWLLMRVLWKLIRKAASSKVFDVYRSSFTATVDVAKEAAKQEIGTPHEGFSFHRIFRPFQQFALLWCLLTVNSTSKALSAVSLLAILIILFRVVRAFLRFLDGSVNLLGRLETRISVGFDDLIKKVLTLDPSTKEFISNVQALKLFQNIFLRFRKREPVERAMRALTLFIAMPYYGYISILCGVVYYETALLYGIRWHLSEALVTALFVPFAYTDLPHPLAIRLLGGLQASLLVFVGYEAVFRRLSEKTESLMKVADNISTLLERNEVQARLVIFDKAKQAQGPNTESKNEAPASATSGSR